MRLFRRAPRSIFPSDMRSWLAIFGRHALDPSNSRIDGDIWSRLGPLYEYATADREGFLAELRAVVAGDESGFATYGAARLAWEMYGTESLKIPSALPLIDAGIDFKLARGLPRMMFTGYEIDRMYQIRQLDS